MYGSQVSASSIIRPGLGVSAARAIGLPFNSIIGLQSRVSNFADVAMIMYSVLTKFADNLFADNHFPKVSKSLFSLDWA